MRVREEQEMRVWDLKTLRPLHTMKQPAGNVGWVASEGRGRGVAVGDDVVVWGRRGWGGGG